MLSRRAVLGLVGWTGAVSAAHAWLNVDWPAILKAASAAGVAHYIVEQDQTPGDPVDSLRQSFGYVSKLKF